MAVARIKRVHIFAHSSVKDRLMERLQEVGLLHIAPLDETEMLDTTEPLGLDTREIEQRISEVENAIDYLGRFVPASGFMSSLSGGQFELTEKAFLDLSDDESISHVLEKTRKIQQELADLDVRRTRLLSALSHLHPWTELDAPLELLASTSSIEIFTGSVPAGSMDSLTAALNEDGSACLLEEVSRSSGRCYIVAINLKDEGYDISRILRELAFQPAIFPQTDGTISELQKEMNDDLQQISKQEKQLSTAAAKLSKERIKLLAAFDRLTQLRQRIEGLSSACGTGESIVLSGWAKAEDKPLLISIVEAVSKETAVIDRDPLPEEEPPVAMVNRPIVEPFRVVTNLYGLPKSREIDPTPLLAPFFVLSFGIAVGEGGYGVLLAVLSKLGLKFLKLGEGGRRLLRLLFFCGIATFVAGLLMGSFFAIDFAALPGFLQPLEVIHDKLQLLDPLEDSLLFLGLVLGLGFFQVWVGVLIGAIIKWRNDNKRSAIFHDGAWLVLLPLTVLLGRTIGPIPVLYVWLIAAASIFVSAGFGAVGVGAKVGAGVYALYGITGFFGDILSYSRLFALGLATGVIATVVNILASMSKDIPVIGWFVMIILLIFGHLFNLAINALGAFIHTARLQFVEFFTKFFEGGGRYFVPFSRQFRFTTLVDNAPEVRRPAQVGD